MWGFGGDKWGLGGDKWGWGAFLGGRSFGGDVGFSVGHKGIIEILELKGPKGVYGAAWGDVGPAWGSVWGGRRSVGPQRGLP